MKVSKLGAYVEFQRGYDLPSSDLVDGKYKVVSSNGIFGYHNEFKSGPSVVVGRSGTVGKPQLLLENFWPHNTTLFAKDIKGINLAYLYYLLCNIDINKIKTGSNIPTLNRNHLHSLDVQIEENIEKQGKIADILLNLDNQIDRNNTMIQRIQILVQTTYSRWFNQFEFPNEDGKPYKSSGGKMVYNKTLNKEIPLGWSAGVLSDIANITMGQSPSGDSYNETGEGMLFYQGKTDFGFRYPSPRVYTTKPSRIANKNDILLSVRAPVGSINVTLEECCIGRGLAALNSKFDSNLHLWYVLSDLKKVFKLYDGTGTTFGSINKDELFSLQVIKPDLKVIKQFETIVGKMDMMLGRLELENRKLQEYRDWLLPMLMNGQITIE